MPWDRDGTKWDRQWYMWAVYNLHCLLSHSRCLLLVHQYLYCIASRVFHYCLPSICRRTTVLIVNPLYISLFIRHTIVHTYPVFLGFLSLSVPIPLSISSKLYQRIYPYYEGFIAKALCYIQNQHVSCLFHQLLRRRPACPRQHSRLCPHRQLPPRHFLRQLHRLHRHRPN